LTHGHLPKEDVQATNQFATKLSGLTIMRGIVLGRDLTDAEDVDDITYSSVINAPPRA